MKKIIAFVFMLVISTGTSFAEIKQSDVISFNCNEIKSFLKTKKDKNKDIVEFAERLQKRKCK